MKKKKTAISLQAEQSLTAHHKYMQRYWTLSDTVTLTICYKGQKKKQSKYAQNLSFNWSPDKVWVCIAANVFTFLFSVELIHLPVVLEAGCTTSQETSSQGVLSPPWGLLPVGHAQTPPLGGTIFFNAPKFNKWHWSQKANNALIMKILTWSMPAAETWRWPRRPNEALTQSETCILVLSNSVLCANYGTFFTHTWHWMVPYLLKMLNVWNTFTGVTKI